MLTRPSREAVIHISNIMGDKNVSPQIMVPTSVKREMNLWVAQEGTTQQAIILRVLKEIGFMIKDKDDESCARWKMR